MMSKAELQAAALLLVLSTRKERKMTALQADVAAVKELVKLADAVRGATERTHGLPFNYAMDCYLKLSAAKPAIERLLGIVSAVEKLEAEWRDGLPGMSDGEREIYTTYRKGCADSLKALLDREK